MQKDYTKMVASLRIVELKAVLGMIDKPRTGRKADLQQRLLAVLSEADAPTAYNPAVNELVQRARAQMAERAKRLIEEAYNSWVASRAADYSAALTGRSTAAGQAAAVLQAAAAAGGGGDGGYAVQQARKRQRLDGSDGKPAAAAGLYGAGGSTAAGDFLQQLFGGEDVTGSGSGDGEALLGRAGAGNTRIRCVCRDGRQQAAMLQCSAPNCGVWMHAACMPQAPPAKPGESPQQFYCEQCRAARADPFWELFDTTLLVPVVLRQTGQFVQEVGTMLPQQAGGPYTFTLTPQQMDLLQHKRDEFKLQAMVLQAEDPVPSRFHWPMYCQLRLNGHPPLRPYMRNSNIKLGINQRDEALDLLPYCHAGRGNVVEISATAKGTYVLLVAIARRRNMQQVKALMAPPEPLEAALERARRHLGGAAAGSDDDDDGIEVGNTVLSLKDPYTSVRMTVPVRFKDVSGPFAAFDLEPFLSMAQRTRKWLDPINSKPSTVQKLQVDSYLQAILAALQDRPEVTEVEVDQDGNWRPAGSAEGFRSVLGGPPGAGSTTSAGAAGAAGSGSGAAAGAAGGSGGEVMGLGGGLVKLEPGLPAVDPDAAAAAGGGGGGAAEAVVVDGVDEDDEEEEAEEEELRRAAQAAATMARKKPEPEIIDLLSSSDDDDEPPPPARPATAQLQPLQGAQQGAAAAGTNHQPPSSSAAAAAGAHGSSGAIEQRMLERAQQQEAAQQQRQHKQHQYPTAAAAGLAGHGPGAAAGQPGSSSGRRASDDSQQQHQQGGPLRIRLPSRADQQQQYRQQQLQHQQQHQQQQGPQLVGAGSSTLVAQHSGELLRAVGSGAVASPFATQQQQQQEEVPWSAGLQRQPSSTLSPQNSLHRRVTSSGPGAPAVAAAVAAAAGAPAAPAPAPAGSSAGGSTAQEQAQQQDLGQLVLQQAQRGISAAVALFNGGGAGITLQVASTPSSSQLLHQQGPQQPLPSVPLLTCPTPTHTPTTAATSTVAAGPPGWGSHGAAAVPHQQQQQHLQHQYQQQQHQQQEQHQQQMLLLSPCSGGYMAVPGCQMMGAAAAPVCYPGSSGCTVYPNGAVAVAAPAAAAAVPGSQPGPSLGQGASAGVGVMASMQQQQQLLLEEQQLTQQLQLVVQQQQELRRFLQQVHQQQQQQLSTPCALDYTQPHQVMGQVQQLQYQEQQLRTRLSQLHQQRGQQAGQQLQLQQQAAAGAHLWQ